MKSYILGDVHGAYHNCVDILKHVGILDEKTHWRSDLKDTLIQIGDVLDRGDMIIESFKLLRDIQSEAEKAGGRVVRLVGNHELSYIGGTPISMRQEGYALSEIIKEDILGGRMQAAYLLDDWIVVHAGIIPELSEGKESGALVDEFNAALIDAVLNDDFTDRIFFVGRSRGGMKPPGIFWADYDIDLIPYEDELIKQIVGHSPPHTSSPEIRMSPGEKLINVDMGMCDMYGANKGILVYENSNFIPIKMN